MAMIADFTKPAPQLDRDLLISSYLPLVWLALVEAEEIDEGSPNKVAVRWLMDLALAVGPLLRDCDPDVVSSARLCAETAIAQMRHRRAS
jgi:hypothetical protein